jgi:nucleoside-diphosphate-sugar epimerase
MPPVNPSMIQFYAAKGTVRIDKAKKLLGYEPAFDLHAGMKLTEQWARWANLLG